MSHVNKVERALQLLTASCMVAALGSNAGCWLRPCGGTVEAERDTGLGAPIVAVSRRAAIDERGRMFDAPRGGDGRWISFEHPVRDVIDLPENSVAVGDNGLLLICDRFSEWTRVELGVDADLTKLVALDHEPRIASELLALGPEVILHMSRQGWRELPAPPLGWRGARDIFVAADRLWVVAETTLWSAELPEPPQRVDLEALQWTMHAVDPEGPLIGGAPSRSGDGEPELVIVFGERRLYRFDDGAGMRPIDAAFSGALLEAQHDLIYTSSGTVWVGPDGVAQVEDDGLDATITAVLVSHHSGLRELKGTADGRVLIHAEHHCPGGRPWIVDGRRQVAGPASTDAEPWFAEALAEHASIASFAGFGLELLSLGAPARLIRATLAAQADELRHAQTCLALARRHAGGEPRIGALAIGPIDRAGDPAAIAAALIDEGCVGEGVAATTIELAARACEDAETQAALAGIAADERRHATLAWASLRWLLERHPSEVRPVVCERAATLRKRAPASAEVHRLTVMELVVPLLEAMLTLDAATIARQQGQCVSESSPS